MTATITIDGAWAKLTGAPMSVADDVLAPKDPRRFFNPAYKQQRWDGRVRLNEGRKFPAGLWRSVAYCLHQEGIEYEVVDNADGDSLSLDNWNKDILEGITLYDHQDEVCRALLSEIRGIARSPTASGKGEMIVAMSLYLFREMGWRSLVVVPKKGLAKQQADRFRRYVEGEMIVGQCGDGKKEIGDVTVATAQTLAGFMPRTRKNKKTKKYETIPPNPELLDLVENTEVLIFDEAHHTSADGWYNIALRSKAKRRYGVSGTPLKDSSVSDLKLQGATGPIIIDIPASRLIESGLAAKPKIVMVMSDNASCEELEEEWCEKRQKVAPKGYPAAYEEGVILSVEHNRSVVRAVEWMVDHKRKPLIICRRKAHFQILAELLEEYGISYGASWGATETEERDLQKQLLTDSRIDCILATTIFDEGEDVPAIDAIVLAEGVKAQTNAIQRIGRVMRIKAGANDAWVVDFVPLCHPTLQKHAEQRCAAYEGEGYEVRVLEEWPETNEHTPDDLLPFEGWDEA